MRKTPLFVFGALALVALPSNSPQASTPKPTAPTERPWEVIADNGDMVLPDIFYSDNQENEQVMTLKVHGRHQIDHLIYPTIGNPKIFIRDAASDDVLLVLRLDQSTITALRPAHIPAVRARDNVSPMKWNPATKGDGVFFYLVPRDARESGGGDLTAGSASLQGNSRAIAITPSELDMQKQPKDMPAELKTRSTVRAYFSKQKMQSVSEGLYDIRVETIVGGKLASSGNYPGFDTTYNGLQVYNNGPKSDEEFTVLNFSDTQVNTGWMFQKFAVPHLRELVDYLTSPQSNSLVSAAKYITFNGDLHDGGAVLQRYPRGVATEYNEEATHILDQLKRLKKAVFLTSGNHDGYASMGHVPQLIDEVTRMPKAKVDAEKLDESRLGAEIKKFNPNINLDEKGLDPIETVVQDQISSGDSTWPGLSVQGFDAYLNQTNGNKIGGKHLDIFDGSYVRSVGDTFSSWGAYVAPGDRNTVLYDGHYQWRKTYGPLYYSYSFGKNYYISLNSFEVRQHWRTGWGMYTVNYGGNMSQVQMDWLSRELKRQPSRDVTIFAHHDPRGGHNGKDYPYYFSYVTYGDSDALRPDYFAETGATSSAEASLAGKNKYLAEAVAEEKKLRHEWEYDKINKIFGKLASLYGDNGLAYSFANYALSEELEPMLCKDKDVGDQDVAELGCMHDGLQEWMRHDPEFDCPTGVTAIDGNCAARWYSGYELLNLLTTSTNVRTMVLGHTHFNSIDEFQAGDELVPAHVTLDSDSLTKLENSGPLRSGQVSPEDVREKSNVNLEYKFNRTLQAATPNSPRELVIIRVTTAADLTSQYLGESGKNAMYGFQGLIFKPQPDSNTGELTTRLDQITYFRNLHDAKSGYQFAGQLEIDRGARYRAANGNNTPADAALVKDNPLRRMFRLGSKATADKRTPEQIMQDELKLNQQQ